MLFFIHIDSMFEVKKADRIIIQVGEFYGSSVLGVTQLHWRLWEQKRTENWTEKVNMSFTNANDFVEYTPVL